MAAPSQVAEEALETATRHGGYGTALGRSPGYQSPSRARAAAGGLIRSFGGYRLCRVREGTGYVWEAASARSVHKTPAQGVGADAGAGTAVEAGCGGTTGPATAEEERSEGLRGRARTLDQTSRRLGPGRILSGHYCSWERGQTVVIHFHRCACGSQASAGCGDEKVFDFKQSHPIDS